MAARASRLLHSTLLGACLCMSAGISAAASEVTVDWASERCDFILTKNQDGHGVVLKLTPVVLEQGEVLVGDLDRINYSGRVVRQSNGEGVMMRGLKYGVRRRAALDTILDWGSRYCKPPTE